MTTITELLRGYSKHRVTLDADGGSCTVLKLIREVAMNGYSVYVNYIHDKAIVHRSSCPFANEGNGIHPDAIRRIDGWMTFSERDRAFLAAHKTGKSEVRGCSKCNP
jgi:hypothetical protein